MNVWNKFRLIINLHKIQIALSGNLISGFLLWFFWTTDYSISGTIPSLMYPIFVGILGIYGWNISKNLNSRLKRTIARFSSLPSIMGGTTYTILVLVMLIPPMCLGTMFFASEVLGEKRIQRAYSPDGNKYADVHFRASGAYAGGSGRVSVSVKYKYLPFIEKSVFYIPDSHIAGSEESENYLEWRSNSSIYISEIDEEISVDEFDFKVPGVFHVIGFVVAIIDNEIDDQRSARELSETILNVPKYPDSEVDERSQYTADQDTAFRSFFAEGESVEDVFSWYQAKLSEPPWTIIDIRRIEKADPLLQDEICIKARHIIEGIEHTYYWELWGIIVSREGTIIYVGTPLPYSNTCEVPQE